VLDKRHVHYMFEGDQVDIDTTMGQAFDIRQYL
jgi:hypothetical protein